MTICGIDSTERPFGLGTGICIKPNIILTAYHILHSEEHNQINAHPIIAWINPKESINSIVGVLPVIT